ncbi:HlyD family efflux transporter periplasmic adaptor subunit [Marinobacterium sp. xm-d-530]|uniref:HlyD family efflux transporter periplasmic adaptor subunit n=1 Tax=Marinobacterium sp. xm-d-530 TaxID=2497747 RepID=UPI001568CF28|nr:HlyD family efflux transporter periplasmic adaptor subunit [Marinobacterium sp. xm-d-530]NRQ01165.1 Type I secretion system membrane fusion protein PrsE [Marinobacterium sp. xm-d-530]
MKFLKSLLSPLGVFWVLVGLLVTLTWWAFVFEIDKSITLPGNVRPLKASSGIQTINGGRIKSFDLVTGQMIKAGDVIATFDFSEQNQKAQELLKQKASLSIAKDRLVAGLDKATHFVFKDGYDAYHFDIQRKIFDAQLEANMREKSSVSIQIENLKEQQKVLEEQLRANKAAADLAAKKVRLVKELFERGFEGEIAYLTALQELDATRVSGQELNSKTLQIEREQELLNQKIVQIDTQFSNQLANELFQVSMQVEQISSELNVLNAQVTKQNLVSPASGRVTKINVDSLGQVVEPGFVLAEYVPLDTEMAFEMRINPQNINDIQPAQSGKIVLSNMDVRGGDKLEGVVFEIDGDVTVTKDGMRYYSAIAKIVDQKNSHLIPGVDGTIAINVGVRTIANYFLEPIIETMSNAMREK